jgi:hypothetical protein
MWFWSLLLQVFDGDLTLTVAAFSVLILTVLSAVVGYFIKSTGFYAALCLLFSCAGVVFFLLCGVERERLSFLLAVEGAGIGIGYATIYTLLEVGKRIASRRERRAEIRRRVQFTLPDRDNEYLKGRLQTALRVEKGDFIEEKGEVRARMGYAKRMLAQIKEASLTPIERIDVEEMARLMAAYEQKEKWSATDVKTMSELFSRLLKLSAKYGIAV